MEKMKKIIYWVAGIMLLFNACTEKEIEVTPTKELKENYYLQSENVPTILASTYNFLWVRTGPWGNSHRAWGNFPSDDAYTGGADDSDQQTYQDADTYQVTPLDPASNLLTQWKTNFQGIYACNLLIDYVLPTTDQNRKAIAEAKFLKAFYYFELARMFGGLPLVKKTPSPVDMIPRSSYDETLEYIATLLREAIEAKRLDGSPALTQRTEPRGPNNGAATLAAAQALLGKVYLYQKKYSDAINILLEVDKNPNYQLEEKYADIFEATNKFGKESIFEVSYSKPNADGRPMGNGEIQLFGPRPATLSQFDADLLAGWGFNQPTKSLVDAYKSQNDYVRLNKTVISSDSLQAIYRAYSNNETIQIVWKNPKDGYWDGKHLPRNTNRGNSWQNDQTNTIILRLADVYLMLAEAYNRTSNDAEARKYLNRVRTRVGLLDVAATGDALYEAIKLERRLELALEGERYFDLLRWGDAEKYLGPLGWTQGTPGKKTNGWFPIPQAEINRTDGPNRLVQNPGY